MHHVFWQLKTSDAAADKLLVLPLLLYHGTNLTLYTCRPVATSSQHTVAVAAAAAKAIT